MEKVPFKKAFETIINEAQKINFSTEYVFLNEALSRVLAEDIYAKFNIPDGNKSAIDGFAINTNSLDTLPKRFKILKDIPPESIEEVILKDDEAAFVMTGAYTPKNANACIKIEDSIVDSNFEFVTINKRLKDGELINFEGQELKKESLVLKKDTFLDFKKIALLAHLGYFKIKVYRKLRVGIFTSGNEIKEPYYPYSKGTVYNTNFYLISNLLKEVFKDNISISYLGILKDDKEKIFNLLKNTINNYDIIVTCGGISKGKYDFIRPVAKNLFKILVENTNIRPGSPFLFGKKENSFLFSLPGYPSATLVNAIIYLISFIKAIFNLKPYLKTFEAILRENLKGKKGRTDLVRVYLDHSQGYLSVYKENLPEHTSNFYSMAIADALAIIDEGKDYAFKGEYIKIIDFQNLL